tara:strand:- start:338 stop:898 length:561 start_codon:yes stop_codon:yes gene_type:complete
MILYPYFAEWYFDGEPLKSGLFLGTSIHETSQVAAAGLIYDQQFNNPETLNVATVTKLIRNTFLVIMIPLFAFLYNRGEIKSEKYSILSIFPYFVIGFISMIIVRNLGDQFFTSEKDNYEIWINLIEYIKVLATVFLTMAMAAVGISINLNELKSMGYKPFVVGLIAAITVGIISLAYIEISTKII